MPLNPSKVRARREKLKLTQQQAAKAAGLLRPNWARIESGNHTDPNLSTAQRIAEALKCSLAALVD